MKKILLTGLFLLLATSCLAEMISVSHLPAEVRDKAMVSGSNVIKQLDLYAPLEVLENGAAYLKVKTADGIVGYIHKSLTTATHTVTVTADLCNVRSGPGKEFPVAFKAKKGNSFQLLAQEQKWVQVKAADDKTGWIWQDLVWGE
ncbi:SH3 domain-containing protein [Malonomonas rubra]|uniref:SH3 domain-containing protein n=1 Tax=Malonomonas rubra TaxID=57040 RepID=UPI0026E97348|nr:SH3 domain-containing protein [Malonomonas rubra]